MPEITELKQIASQIRRDIVRMINGAQSGHPGGSLGCTDFFAAMYFDILEHNVSSFDPDAKNEDLLIVSNGHISPVLYSSLARSGYFPVNELGSFRKLNSRLQGHPATLEKLPGIRVATGSLGQGLSVSIGIALAKKLNKDPKIVFCLMGDGELEEGQVWEAVTYAGAKNTDNLIAVVDYNKKQIDGPTDVVMPLLDLRAKFEAFGWKVIEMNGNEMEDVVATINKAKTLTGNGQPIMILMHTEMGAGVDFMMGTHKWHGNFPNDEQLEIALSQLEETLGDY
ncbi:MAG: transketolase [Bacteroidetes bacterium]|nr:MAG: transketolase [Bacteroidota bacterium]